MLHCATQPGNLGVAVDNTGCSFQEIVVAFGKFGACKSLPGSLEHEVDVGTLKLGLNCAADASDGTIDAATT